MLNHIRVVACVIAVSALMCGQHALAQSFSLLVTQTPPGSIDITNPANWGGVLRYDLAGTGAAAVPGVGIGSASLEDPAGLIYSPALGELFVANRRGNTGTASFNRFLHTPGGGFTANGSFTAAGLQGAHQPALQSDNSELYSTTVSAGVQIFTTPGGVPGNGGVILNGATRGSVVSPDGTRLYVTTGGSTIRQFDLVNDIELTALNVIGASGLHYLRFRGNGELYAADFGGDQVFKFTVASNVLTPAGAFVSTDPISLAFSPDLSEMFVSTHQSSTVIHRYLFNNNTSAWDFTSDISVGQSLGDIYTITIPEPGSMSFLALSALALLGRRKAAGDC